MVVAACLRRGVPAALLAAVAICAAAADDSAPPPPAAPARLAKSERAAQVRTAWLQRANRLALAAQAKAQAMRHPSGYKPVPVRPVSPGSTRGGVGGEGGVAEPLGTSTALEMVEMAERAHGPSNGAGASGDHSINSGGGGHELPQAAASTSDAAEPSAPALAPILRRHTWRRGCACRDCAAAAAAKGFPR